MKYDFIIISTADWNYPFWTNKQHIAKRLADRGHNVLYIDSLGLRRPTVNSRDVKRIFTKLGKFTEGLQKKQNNLWVWSPVVIPFNGNKKIRELNFKFLQFALKYFSNKLGFDNPILWVYNPLSQKLVGNLNEKLTVYHCVDELSAQPGMPIDTLQVEEGQLLKKVEIVFATSLNLYNTRKDINSNTYYSPNVADFEHFSKATNEVLEIPEDIMNIKGPIIGFIGAINGYKLDLDLIVSVAKMNSDKNFVLIGQVGEGDPWTNISLLEEIDNIYLIGPRDYEVLPNYLKAFDVCLLPNNINEYTMNMFPMKFFEYLSAGKPVVMTSLPALKDYYNLCYVGDTAEEFTIGINDALSKNDYALREMRINEAKKHDWESRIDKMIALIMEQEHKTVN